MGAAAPASAQSVARFVLDSAISVDRFGGENVSDQAQVVIDISAGVRLGDHWQLYVRPWFRLPRATTPTGVRPAWEKELYQAGVRYERPGAVATRVDAGYIISPIGLGLLDSRPNLNPTILTHLSYVVPMLPFDPTGPRVVAISASYPLGAQLTVSTTRWDARAAVINSAPTRAYLLGAVTNPRQTPVAVFGGGVTPMTGIRLGASFAHGVYATPAEITRPGSAGRSMTMAGGEGELAFAHTSIRGEIVRTAFETSTETAVAYEWFVEGIQTLSPRWFVAGREEGTSAPPLRTGTVVGQRTNYAVVEATVGFRVNPEITLRGSFDARRFYGSTNWDNQAGVSVVWARRWW